MKYFEKYACEQDYISYFYCEHKSAILQVTKIKITDGNFCLNVNILNSLQQFIN